MADERQDGIARELGFLPHEEARKFPWSKRATPRRVLDALGKTGKPTSTEKVPVMPRGVEHDEGDWTA